MWKGVRLWWWRLTKKWCVVYDYGPDRALTNEMISIPMDWRGARNYAQIFGGTPMPEEHFGSYEMIPEGQDCRVTALCGATIRWRLKKESRTLVSEFEHFGEPVTSGA